MKLDTVVFDLGGVLIDWNPRYLYRKLIKDEQEVEKFLTEVCHMGWNLQHDAGKPFAQGISELVSQFPEHEKLIRAYFDRWPEMMSGPIEGTVKILEEIHRGRKHRLFALSNWSAETYPHARKLYPFFTLFEKVLLSGEEKIIKPDPRFFHLLHDRYNVDLKRAVFVDDVERNILAAQELGFQTVQFKSPEQLREDLKRLGVL